MNSLNYENRINIYTNPARDLTVVQGRSGVLYPFYRSSGLNSSCDSTWFPWMGYFDKHPQEPNQIYMVKPSISDLSTESKEIINKYLGSKADAFINRIGNDESLAISCSIGEGVWKEYPDMRKEIMNSNATKPYLKALIIDSTIPLEIQYKNTQRQRFRGKHTVVITSGLQAGMATAMEKATSEECTKYISKPFFPTAKFSIQDKKEFPSQKNLKEMEQEKEQHIKQARQIREKYLQKLGIKRPQEESLQVIQKNSETNRSTPKI